MKQKSLSYLSIAAIAAMFPLAAQAQITATFTGASGGAIEDPVNWSSNPTLPNQAGDVGNATVNVSVASMGTNNWAGTLNMSNAAQLNLGSNDVTGTWNDVNLSGGAWLRLTMGNLTANNRSFGNDDGSSNITIGTGGASLYRSQDSNGTGTFNVYGTINVDGGTLTVTPQRESIISIRNNLNLNNGNNLAVTAFGTAGRLELAATNTTRFTFANNGDTASNISGAGGRLINWGGDLDIDLSGFEWNQTAERSWALFDWGSFAANSGFVVNDGIVKSGTEEWTIASGTSRYYNEAGGLVWTYSSGGLDWTFTESTGVLSVVPEPSTVALLTGLLALGVVFVRRRTSK